MPVYYEWDVETFYDLDDSNDGDIIDHNHADAVRDLLDALRPPTPATPDMIEAQWWGPGMLKTRLVLVRNQLDAHGEEIVERAWAYVEDGKLPEHFDEGQLVPQRFHRELALALAKHATAG